jgi:hypothetical protein
MAEGRSRIPTTLRSLRQEEKRGRGDKGIMGGLRCHGRTKERTAMGGEEEGDGH